MSDHAVRQSQPPVRFPTGVPGLDTLLNGGLLRGGIYLIKAPPGGGKTILANQICFSHARQEGRILYVTLLAETHARMFAHLQGLSYFDQALIPEPIMYISYYRTLEQTGMGALVAALQQEVLKRKPTLLVVDGLAVAGEIADSPVMLKKFVHELNVFASVAGCTTLLLTSQSTDYNRPEHTIVDGIIELSLVASGLRTYREIEVRKLRGSAHLQGRHYACVTDRGMTVYPRLESVVAASPRDLPYKRRVVKTGIPSFDRLVGGGISAGSTTVLIGSGGTGKTTFGLHVLDAGIRARESCLYFGYYERPQRILHKAATHGLAFAKGVENGLLHLEWRVPAEHFLDAEADRLLQAVRRHRVQRLFIDGVEGLLDGGEGSARYKPFMAALCNELRALDVTTVISEETKLFDPSPNVPISDLSEVTENIIYLSNGAEADRMRRGISVIKLRDSSCDAAMHEMRFTDQGLTVSPKARSSRSGKPTRRARRN